MTMRPKRERYILGKKWGYLQLRASVIKNLPANAGELGSVSGSGRFPGEGNVSPLQYSCLENPMDRGVWWAIVHRVTKGWTQLSD